MKRDNKPLQDTRPDAHAGEGPLLRSNALAGLLNVVGQAQAGAFLDQLQSDLGSALAVLHAAAASGDRAGLQRSSHNLIALAGTVAATQLEAAAQELNIVVHSVDNPPYDKAALQVDRLTEQLIAELRAFAACRGPIALGVAG